MTLEQTKTLVTSVFVTFCAMLLCGTLGAPKQIANVETEFSWTQGVQICYQNSGTQAPGEMLQLSLGLNQTTAATAAITTDAFEVSIKGYDSDRASFFGDCLQAWQNPLLPFINTTLTNLTF